jgi:hypothetical protein
MDKKYPTIKFLDNYKYVLSEIAFTQTSLFPDEWVVYKHISLSPLGMLSIDPGFPWDGASSIAWDRHFMRASLFHDALYMLIRKGLLASVSEPRLKSDREMKRLCLDAGMWKIRAAWVFRGVRIGAAKAAHTSRKVKEAR